MRKRDFPLGMQGSSITKRLVKQSARSLVVQVGLVAHTTERLDKKLYQVLLRGSAIRVFSTSDWLSSGDVTQKAMTHN